MPLPRPSVPFARVPAHRRIDDATFLAARAIYDAATAEFDVAFAAASEAQPAAFEAPEVNQISFDL